MFLYFKDRILFLHAANVHVRSNLFQVLYFLKYVMQAGIYSCVIIKDDVLFCVIMQLQWNVMRRNQD
jgi:hypothetical protein